MMEIDRNYVAAVAMKNCRKRGGRRTLDQRDVLIIMIRFDAFSDGGKEVAFPLV